MGYVFEWDPKKVECFQTRATFDEASTVFGDPLAFVMPDLDHSHAEERFL